jgi:LacI family transcriptional regulator
MGVPFTFIDRMVETERFNSVVADDRGGAYAATEQAISIGYRKLAILGGFQHTNIGRERYRGFATALKRYDIPVRPEWIIHGGFSEDDGYRGFKRLFEAGALPEFIFAVTYPVTLGVYRAADELGIRIPDDVDIICFGNSGVNRFLNPPVSYVEQPTRELGRRAFELTLENIQQRDDFSPQHIVLPTTLVLSKTCVKRVAGRKKG